MYLETRFLTETAMKRLGQSTILSEYAVSILTPGFYYNISARISIMVARTITGINTYARAESIIVLL